MLIHELVSAAAAAVPDRPALVSPDGATATFAELDHQIRAVAAWVAERSAPGDRVAVIADNSVAYALLYYAVPRSGRLLTLINQRLGPAEQTTQLAATRPALVTGDPQYLDVLPDVDGSHVVAFGSAEWSVATQTDSAITWPSRPDDPAWLLFTSGSTGTPKGVIHTHRSVTAGVWGSVEGRSVTAGGVYLLPFPMCHIAGYNMLVQHAARSTVVLAAQFRAETFTQTVREHGVTSCSLAPTMLHALLSHLERSGRTLPTLKSIAYGSAAIPADLLRRALELLDVDFHQGYGMTETAGNVTFLGPQEHRAGAAGDTALLAGAGRPHSRVQVRIAGGTNEILVRGGQVAAGYWPDRSAVDSDGWFSTGDIGRIDSAGRLFVVDRRKDIVVTGGENVSSREVEDALSTHPDVEMAAVVGIPDDYWGEAVCAVVVVHPGRTPTGAELITHVRSQLAAFKRPRHVLFVDALPRNTNRKVAKDVVREHARTHLGR